MSCFDCRSCAATSNPLGPFRFSPADDAPTYPVTSTPKEER